MIDYPSLLQHIENWEPMQNYSSEEGFRSDLARFLFDNLKIKVEQNENVGIEVDILVDKKFPIEVKKSPNTSEYDRLRGQTDRYLEIFDSLIVVICKKKSRIGR